MPIQIGQLTNVPNAGSPISSPWAQDVSRQIVHHFATVAARNAQWTDRPVGSLCTIDNLPGLLFQWNGTQWVTTMRGSFYVSSSGFGDAAVAFATPFPSTCQGVVVTPSTAQDVWWWPLVYSVTAGGFSFFTVSVNGYPFASGHPPGISQVWTIANAGSISGYYTAWGY
jgi:hypothetical protein